MNKAIFGDFGNSNDDILTGKNINTLVRGAKLYQKSRAYNNIEDINHSLTIFDYNQTSDISTRRTFRENDISIHETEMMHIMASKEGNGIKGRGIAPNLNLNFATGDFENFTDNSIKALSTLINKEEFQIVVKSFCIRDIRDNREYNLETTNDNKAFKDVITSSSLNSGKGLFYLHAIGNGQLQHYENIEKNLTSENNFFKGQYDNICDQDCKKFIKTSLPSYPWSSDLCRYPTYYNNIGYRYTNMPMREALNIGEHMFLTVSTKSGLIPLNYNRSHIGGSSFASPIVGAIVGLMLEANSNLTYRDIKHILISTAKPLSKPIKIAAIRESNIQLLRNRFTNFRYTIGYKDTITNQAGYSFHIFDGFGQPDVDAAVNMARDYHKNITKENKFPDGGNSQGDYDKIKVIFKQVNKQVNETYCIDFFL